MPAGAFGYSLLTMLAVVFLHESISPPQVDFRRTRSVRPWVYTALESFWVWRLVLWQLQGV